jgi:hypothetical protein
VVDEEGCIQIILIPPQGSPDGEPTVEIEAGPPLFDVRMSITSSRKWGERHFRGPFLRHGILSRLHHRRGSSGRE